MADKPTKKPSGGADESSGKPNLFVDAVSWILFILVLYSVIKGFVGAAGFSFDSLPSVTEIFATIFNTVQVFSVFFSLLFFIGIIYFNFKLGELSHHGHADHEHGHDASHASHSEIAQVHYSNKKWQHVLEKLDSSSEGDWRLAIIEADIILDDMLKGMGYQGDGIAEKLKQADKSEFITLDLAWEAHKIRNRIAHDGAAFHMTRAEAKRVIDLFRRVFEEFYFI